MLLYRIVHKMYATTLHAPGVAGRWNSEGNKVIYTAESVAVAFLENMVRRKGLGFNNDFKIMTIKVPSSSSIEEVDLKSLPEAWREAYNYSACQQIGDSWYIRQSSLLLKVPSAVLPQGFNFVINAMHSQIAKVKLVIVTDLMPDTRIEEILKSAQQ